MAKQALARGKPEAAAEIVSNLLTLIQVIRFPLRTRRRHLTLAQSIMDLFNPADTRPVHFLGIGGAGMSALALIACRRGVAVTGCDADPSRRRRSDARWASQVHAGHDPSHLEGARAVVVTAAVPADHPELRRARELGLPVVPRKVALAALVGDARSVGVSGTHGKTTTTVMTTEALAVGGAHAHRSRRRPGRRPGAATPGSTATSSSWSRPTNTTRRSSPSIPPSPSSTTSKPTTWSATGRSRRWKTRSSSSPGAPTSPWSTRTTPARCGWPRGSRARGGSASPRTPRSASSRRGPGRRGHRGHGPVAGRQVRAASSCGCRASTTFGTRSPRSARWKRWVGRSQPAADALARVHRRGAPVRAAGRAWRRRGGRRLRAPPVGAGRDALRRAAGVSRAAGWWRSSSRICTPAPSRTARRWGRRSRPRTWSSSPRSTPRGSSRCRA